MDLLEHFLERHENIHTMNAQRLVQGLTDEQVRSRPRADVNSIAWLVWHMARCEDVGMNRLVTDGRQVLDAVQWPEKMNVPWRHQGTGMTDEEVSDMSRRVDIPALRAYWAAVGQTTREVIPSLRMEDLDEVIDPDHLRRVMVDEGVLGSNAGWVEEFYVGKKKGWFLFHLGLTHNYQHVGEALVIRGMLGLRSR